MKKFDCTFVYINIINDYISGAEYQLNCAYARLYLEKNGFCTMQYINHNSENINDYVDDLNNLNTRYYTFYVNEYNYKVTRFLINRLNKENNKNIIIIGPSTKYIVYHYRHEITFTIGILKHEYLALVELLEKKDISNIDNLCYQEKGVLICNREYDYKYTLDDLGLPYSEGYIPPQEVINVGLISSIGCYGKCLFCSYNTKQGQYYTHSIESILKELDYVSKYIGGYGYTVRFFDDCFSVNQERTILLLRGIKARNYKYSFWCCVRADLLNHEIIDLMSECNFQKIVIGLETASIEVMDKLGKVQNEYSSRQYIEKVKADIDYATIKKISPIFSINFGLPNEKIEDAYKTINFVLENNAINSVSVCYMTCFPGSRVFEESDKYYISKKESPVRLPYRTYYSLYDMKEVYLQMYNAKIIKESEDIAYNEIVRMYTEDLFGNHQININNDVFDTIYVNTIDQEVSKFISNNIALNGKICIITDKLSVKKDLFCEDRKRLKMEIKEYDKYLANSYRYNDFLPNLDFLYYKKDRVGIQRNNWFFKNGIQLQFKSIKTIADLKYFTQKAEKFKCTHKILMKDIKDLNCFNICMFTGRCEFVDLHSIKINNRIVTTTCSNDELGKINNTYQYIKKSALGLKIKAWNQRKCNTCSVREWCSKCISITELWKEELLYCEFMKSNQYFLKYMRLISRIKNFVHDYMFSDSESMEVLLFEPVKINKEWSFNRMISIVEWREQMYIIFLDHSNVIKCSDYEENIIKKLLLSSNDGDINEKVVALIKKGIIESNSI